ncbi:MAG TPA: PEP-CTERM sorting domain-containing protein [Bryobacteraceae bacterium]|nr:PEP-CTERM sorting domain-containing protein [Bryobacteraceae bacterium]
MEFRIAFSALFTVAVILTPAQATPILFNATTTLPSAGNYAQGGTSAGLQIALNDAYGSAGYILAYGVDGLFNGTPRSGHTNLAPTTSATPNVGLTVQPDLGGKEGLGDDNSNAGQDNGFIAPTDGVVLDFANVTKTVNNSSVSGATPNLITFNLYQDYAGADYEVYGSNNDSNWTLIQSGVIHAPQSLTIPALNASVSSLYTYYAIGVTDCAIDVEGVTVQYSGTTTQVAPVPEPGTFVMAGAAILGLGFTIRKRGKSAASSER